MNDISLKEFIEAKFVSIEQATELSRQAMEKRLEGMNEFRETLRDQASKFITRNELESAIEKITIELKSLNKAKDILEGKASQNSVNLAILVAIISILVSIVGFFK